MKKSSKVVGIKEKHSSAPQAQVSYIILLVECGNIRVGIEHLN